MDLQTEHHELWKYMKSHAIPLDVYQPNEHFINKKVFIVGGCELSYVKDYLERDDFNVYHTFDHGTSMDIFSEVNNPSTEIYSFNADYFIMSPVQPYKSFLGKYQTGGYLCQANNNSYPGEKQIDDINGLFQNMSTGIEKVREKSNSPIWIITFPYLGSYQMYGTYDYLMDKRVLGSKEMHLLYQQKVYELARKYDNIYVLDTDNLFEKEDKSKCVKPFQGYTMGHYSYYGSALLAEEFHRQLHIVNSKLKRVKCIVLDLDNTLWKGVLREAGGVEGIRMYPDRINVLESLGLRGIVLALCSKNDETEIPVIDEIFSPNPYYRMYNFVVNKKINWNPKSQNIREIAEELNIGLDSIVFFDDNQFEREEVSANLPQVRVYSDEEIINLPNKYEFHPVSITKESQNRATMYKEQTVRKRSEKSSAGFEDFLMSSQLKLTFDTLTNNPGSIGRVAELYQRTNQLNATLSRTDITELKGYLLLEDYSVYIVSLSDKFGDYGLIGAAIVKSNGEIIELAFSCRAMGKSVERALLIYLHGLYGKLSIGVTETNRNKQIINILKEMDFQEVDREGDLIQLEHIEHKTDKEYEYPRWLNIS